MCRHVVHLCTSLSHRQHLTLESGKLSVSQARMHHASRFSDRFSLSACLQETNRSCCAVWDFYSILFFQRLGSPEFSLATSHLCLALVISIDGRFKPVLRNNVLPSFRQMVLSKPLNSFDIISVYIYMYMYNNYIYIHIHYSVYRYICWLQLLRCNQLQSQWSPPFLFGLHSFALS